MKSDRIKVLIGDDTAGDGVKYASMLRDMGIFAYTRRKEGRVLFESIMNDEPDVVVVDLTLPDMDAIILMHNIIDTVRTAPAVIIVSDIRNSFIERQVMESGASYFLVRPYAGETLCSIIKSVSKRVTGLSDTDVEIVVTDVIQKLGVPAHIKGYQYLRTAIIDAISDRNLMECVTKQLYPCVAKKHDTTSSRVERAIRHAIEIAWDRGDAGTINSFFGYNIDSMKGRPTNSEFIALITDRLRLQMKLSAAV